MATLLQQCRLCNQVKSVDDFSKDPKGRNGRKGQCKVCLNAKQRDRRHATKGAPVASQPLAWVAGTGLTTVGDSPKKAPQLPGATPLPSPGKHLQVSLHAFPGVEKQAIGVMLPPKEGRLTIKDGKFEVTPPRGGREWVFGEPELTGTQLKPRPEEDRLKITNFEQKARSLVEIDEKLRNPATPAKRLPMLEQLGTITMIKIHDAVDAARGSVFDPPKSPDAEMMEIAEALKQCDKCQYEEHICKVCGWQEDIPEDPKAEAAYLMGQALFRIKLDAMTVDAANKTPGTTPAYNKIINDNYKRRKETLEWILKDKLQPDDIIDLLCGPIFRGPLLV